MVRTANESVPSGKLSIKMRRTVRIVAAVSIVRGRTQVCP